MLLPLLFIAHLSGLGSRHWLETFCIAPSTRRIRNNLFPRLVASEVHISASLHKRVIPSAVIHVYLCATILILNHAPHLALTAPFYFELSVCSMWKYSALYFELQVRPYLTLKDKYGTLFLLRLYSPLLGVGFPDVKYSHTRYKLPRCDSRDRVWTLFSLRDHKMKENAHPGGRPSLFFARARTLLDPLCRSFHWLSATHLVRKSTGRLRPNFPASGPREKFNMRLSCVFRVCELLSRESKYESAEKLFAEGRHDAIRCMTKWKI